MGDATLYSDEVLLKDLRTWQQHAQWFVDFATKSIERSKDQQKQLTVCAENAYSSVAEFVKELQQQLIVCMNKYAADIQGFMDNQASDILKRNESLRMQIKEAEVNIHNIDSLLKSGRSLSVDGHAAAQQCEQFFSKCDDGSSSIDEYSYLEFVPAGRLIVQSEHLGFVRLCDAWPSDVDLVKVTAEHALCRKMYKVLIRTNRRQCVNALPYLSVILESQEGEKLPVELKNNNDGSYFAVFTPDKPIGHIFRVQLFGIEVKGSPMAIDVIEDAMVDNLQNKFEGFDKKPAIGILNKSSSEGRGRGVRSITPTAKRNNLPDVRIGSLSHQLEKLTFDGDTFDALRRHPDVLRGDAFENEQPPEVVVYENVANDFNGLDMRSIIKTEPLSEIGDVCAAICKAEISVDQEFGSFKLSKMPSQSTGASDKDERSTDVFGRRKRSQTGPTNDSDVSKFVKTEASSSTSTKPTEKKRFEDFDADCFTSAPKESLQKRDGSNSCVGSDLPSNLKTGTKSGDSLQLATKQGFLTDYIKKGVTKVKTEFITKIGRVGHDDDCLYLPVGVIVNHIGDVIICDMRHHAVKVFSADGKLLHLINGERAKQKLVRPSATVVNEMNQIFIKDDRCIHLYTSSACFVKLIGDGDLSRPYGLALNKYGHLVTVDSVRGPPAVCCYSQDGQIISRSSINPDFAPGSKPRFVECLDDAFFIVDLGKSVVYKTDFDGNMLGAFGQYGRALGQFNEPSGITSEGDGVLLIADSRNNRIQMFTPDGKVQGCVELAEEIVRPSDIHLSKDGLLYVSNYLKNCIKVFRILPP